MREKNIDAMKIENRRDNECCLNPLTDYYGDTVLGSNRREVLSREKLLELIGKAEETRQGRLQPPRRLTISPKA